MPWTFGILTVMTRVKELMRLMAEPEPPGTTTMIFHV
jgi:hypothetical protein